MGEYFEGGKLCCPKLQKGSLGESLEKIFFVIIEHKLTVRNLENSEEEQEFSHKTHS